MAYDDIEFEYHLTPDGWKTGDPPSNRIETWICHQYQASPVLENAGSVAFQMG